VCTVTLVAAATWVYSTLRRSHQHMRVLDEFSAGLGSAVVGGDAVADLLSRFQQVLRADWTWLIVRDGLGVRTIEFDGSDVRRGLALEADVELVAQIEQNPDTAITRLTTMQEHRHREIRSVIATALPVADGSTVVMAVGRRSQRDRFDAGDTELCTRMALHGGVAMRNVRLVERLRAESARNRHRADHDALTGLINRQRFRGIVGDALDKGDHVSVLLIDLDRFKEVNDTLGHHNGDLLLAEAAGRMRNALGTQAILARLGGDEFGAMIHGTASEQQVVEMARQLRNEMQRPFQLGQVRADVGASVGIAQSTGTDDVGDLLRRADVAMYAAKSDHTGLEVYHLSLDQHSTERLELVPRLRQAIEQGELALHFQPQIELSTGAIVGAETLLRWPVVGVGYISPDTFLPIAEQTDLIRPLTRWVLSQSIEQCAAWWRMGRELRVSVNLSARNLLEPDLVAFLSQSLQRVGLPGRAMRVELTETAVLSRPDIAAEALHELRRAGIGIALDDFGTGHSSLAHLITLPVDEVKIDKSFVSGLGEDPVSERVVRAIVELANSLDLDVMAEGVETSRHADILRGMGCPGAQGYFFARPMTPSDLDRWLADHQRWHDTESNARRISHTGV